MEVTRTRPAAGIAYVDGVDGIRRAGGWRGWNNRAVYKPAVRRPVFRLCIKMTDNSRSYAGRLESSRCGDNDASAGVRRAGLHETRAADINPFTCSVTQWPHVRRALA
jgi:hypothetical protein